MSALSSKEATAEVGGHCERFGAERRNDWLAAMATEMDIEAATPAELGRTFRELDGEFRGWLADQR